MAIDKFNMLGLSKLGHGKKCCNICQKWLVAPKSINEYISDSIGVRPICNAESNMVVEAEEKMHFGIKLCNTLPSQG